MKRTVFFLLIVCLVCSGAWADENNTLARSLFATILVPDPDEAAREIISWTDERDGYFLIRSSDMVEVRFPTDLIADFRGCLDGISEDVFDLSIEAYDMSEEILSLTSGIQAREEILEKNLEYIDAANVKGTLAIEREVMRLLSEIESMKGRLNRINVDIRLARAQVSFTYKDESLPEDIPSSFGWINRVDFYRFLREGF